VGLAIPDDAIMRRHEIGLADAGRNDFRRDHVPYGPEDFDHLVA
jgi:hypothetical protein